MMVKDSNHLATTHFEGALQSIIDRVFVGPQNSDFGDTEDRKIAVAYSGGLDSSVLLHLMAQYARAHQIKLYAFHIHHGLSPDADAWSRHCEQQSNQLEIHFCTQHIEVPTGNGDGVEGAARIVRYAALGDLCRQYRVPLLVTAHHENDQAETVLLQLLRGSGVAGLSGMDRCNQAPALLNNETLFMARPLLSMTRAVLQELATVHGITFVEDSSNADLRYTRNALRHEVMPLLERVFPNFTRRVARSSQHAQHAQQLMIELGAQDLVRCGGSNGDGKSVDIDQLRRLQDASPARCDNVLRYWFGSQNVRMPSTAWLHQMRKQLLSAKEDAQVLVRHAECDIHRYRNQIVMTVRRDKLDEEEIDDSRVAFNWQGEPVMHFPAFSGHLHFASDKVGFDANWLGSQNLQLQWRSPGWRLKPAANRSTRALKYWYQYAGVPPWERDRLPLVTDGTRLLYAAGIGMDCHFFNAHSEECIALQWVTDTP
jgi:tRNA(Ile)-lysidine synthase